MRSAGRSLEGKLIHRADVFPHEIDAVAATDGRVVVAEHIPGKANPGAKASSVRIFQCGIASFTRQAVYAQLAGATAVNQRVLAGVPQRRIEVADVAQVVMKRTQHFGSQAQVQRELRAHLPIILGKEGIVVVAVLVVVDAAATKTEIRPVPPKPSESQLGRPLQSDWFRSEQRRPC